MKNKILLLGLLVTLFSYASERSTLNIKYDIERTIISLNNVKEGQQLFIKDINGVVLYTEIIKENGSYSKRFDLSALPLGDYYFEFVKDIEIKVTPFKVETYGVEIFTEKETSIFKPFVRSEKNKVYLSRLSMNNQPLKVTIYYDGKNDEELIFSEKIKNENIAERVFVLDEQQKGIYRIIVKTEGRTFSHVMSL